MQIHNYQQHFGAWDITGTQMRSAIKQWFALYYGQETAGEDPCQRIAYSVVNKLTKGVFSEYACTCTDSFSKGVMQALDAERYRAMQLALVGGECYIKPWLAQGKFRFSLVPRDKILIFARDAQGAPTDVGTVQQAVWGNCYYTLLERRTVGDDGCMTVTNTLYQSRDAQTVGQPVSLGACPEFRMLPQRYTFPKPLGGIGMVRLSTPMVNCVDGSQEPVSVYAPATALIHAIDRNEALLAGEFERGQSRVFLSRDLLDVHGELSANLFTALEGDPEEAQLQIFAPALREQSFIARKQEYLRGVETVIGLKRGMLSDVSTLQRTATEVADSQGEYSLTVMDFQRMWQQAALECVALCQRLAEVYGIQAQVTDTPVMDWGNGVLFDEAQLWQEYKDMVDRGLLAPEVALGWRFGMEAETVQQRQKIREKYMPK